MKNFILRYKTLAAVVVVLVIGIGLYIAGNRAIGNWLFAITSIIVLIPIVLDMAKSIAKKEYGLDLLAVTAVSASLALGEFLTAIVIVLMLTGGEALEDYAQERAKKELNELLKRAPKIAHKKIGKLFKDVPIDSVLVGDILRIKPGEVIPVDAIIVTGASTIDESALTGESFPVDKTIGQSLMSGSINQQAAIEVRALKTSHDSQYEQIIAMVSEAASSRSPLVRLADKYSLQFTGIAFALAGLAWVFSGEPIRALEVLVVATPCPLLIATPAAIVSGMSRAASHGIIIKNGAALETLARLDAIAFDKTGTLTRGAPEVKHILPIDSLDEGQLLAMAAAAESHSAHTLAHAVVNEAKRQKIILSAVTVATEKIGSGIQAKLKGKKLLVGKYAYLHEAGVHLPSGKALGAAEGETAIFVSLDGVYQGAITFSDSLRPEAAETVARLKREHVKNMMMLTGDKKSVAERIAHEVGITHVEAECLPVDKLNAIKRFKKRHHPLAFVGDGINDTPSLAAADVGIALGAKGSTAASEAADVVIMLDDFSKVADSVHISHRSIKIAKQSIFIGIGLSIGLMILAGVTGVIKPVYGAMLQEVVDVIVILNALRAHQDR